MLIELTEHMFEVQEEEFVSSVVALDEISNPTLFVCLFVCFQTPEASSHHRAALRHFIVLCDDGVDGIE